MNALNSTTSSNPFKKEDMKPIVLGFENLNGDYGFFAEYREVTYKLKGIKLTSAYESIDNMFAETDYYLLENNKVGKFIRKDPNRHLLFVKTPLAMKRLLNKEKKVSKLIPTLDFIIAINKQNKVENSKTLKKTA